MQRSLLACLFVLVSGLLACGISGGKTTETFHTCRACLADDPHRCASASEDCGDLPDESTTQVSARDKLCESLPGAVIAKRPTPQGYKPSPWIPNACEEWPDSAFKYTCTTFKKSCGLVPIH